MEDLGRFQLGQFVPLLINGVNGSGTPSAPSACPTAKVLAGSDPTTIVQTVSMPARDTGNQTALFTYWMRLSSSYSAGVYIVACNWTISGSTYGSMARFEVVAGGNNTGNVIGAVGVDRPEARQIVYQLDGGTLNARRNPR